MMEIQLWKLVWQCDAPIGSARSRIRTIPFQSQCRWIESRSITFIERPIPNLRPGWRKWNDSYRNNHSFLLEEQGDRDNKKALR